MRTHDSLLRGEIFGHDTFGCASSPPASIPRTSSSHLASRSAARVACVATLALSPLALISSAAHASSLRACPVFSNLAVKPVSADVKAALTSYYATRKMTPISIYKGEETILSVQLESTGVHWCRNLDGSKSGYVGVVPKSSTAAVMVHVKHKAYAGTEAASTYATLARSSSGVWKVVSDDTAP